jgi:hypothetical protein
MPALEKPSAKAAARVMTVSFLFMAYSSLGSV